MMNGKVSNWDSTYGVFAADNISATEYRLYPGVGADPFALFKKIFH